MFAPKLTDSKGETLVKHELFEVQKWNLDAPREIIGFGHFAIVLLPHRRCSLVDVDSSPRRVFSRASFVTGSTNSAAERKHNVVTRGDP